MEEKREKAIDAYENAAYSPAYVSEDVVPPGTEIVEVSEDLRRLEFSRSQCRATGRATVRQFSLAWGSSNGYSDLPTRSVRLVGPLTQQV